MNPEHYDVVVVGAGIHGAGIAQIFALNGSRVLVLEQYRIASQTSSRSSKLIHGGLRYLETAQFSLVRECLEERDLLLKLAPDLVQLVPFYIPVYRNTSRGALKIRAGLTLYALLGGLRKSVRFRTLQSKEWDQLDGLKTLNLRKVFRYYDAQTDDVALTRAVLDSAVHFGATVYEGAEFISAQLNSNYCTVVYSAIAPSATAPSATAPSATAPSATAPGVALCPLNVIPPASLQSGVALCPLNVIPPASLPSTTNGNTRSCTANLLINASGAWVNQVLARIAPSPPSLPIQWIGGSHIEVADSLPKGIYYIESPEDRRALFVMPWKGHVLVGTTEIVYTGDPAEVTPLEHEVDYLLAAYRHYFPIGSGHVINKFAGLRVLPQNELPVSRTSRDIQISAYPALRPKIITVCGGKLTVYRRTAEKIFQYACRHTEAKNKGLSTRDVVLRAVNGLV